MERMRFEEFTNAVVEKIREYLPETFADATVELQTIMKNNSMKLTGLTIRSQESDACPLIYLEQFFEAYEAGEEMTEVLEQIASTRVSNEFMNTFDVEQITDFSRVKDKIVPRLIGRKWNTALLEERPSTEVADLAVTYHVMFGQEFSVPVTFSLMESWDVDVKELHDIAVRNMESLLPGSFRGMSAILFGGDENTGLDPEDETMFVLSNKEGVFGAAAVLDRRIMRKVIETIGSSFYLLPSSVHEWIVVPAAPDMDVAQLEAMVRSANASVVSPEERLGDRVYRYTIRNGLRIAE